MTLRQAFQVVFKHHNLLSKNNSFAKDIVLRYPDLTNSVHSSDTGIVFIDPKILTNIP